jgi:large subunit ribosomal protein L22
MIVKAEAKFIRLQPTKTRLVLDLVRNKGVEEAHGILLHLNKRPKEFLLKLLKQAVSNAKVKGFEPKQLYISKITCDNGPMWKRYKAAAFGRATSILKRTSHIKIELDVKS